MLVVLVERVLHSRFMCNNHTQRYDVRWWCVVCVLCVLYYITCLDVVCGGV